MVFWCFEWVQNGNIGQKWVNQTSEKGKDFGNNNFVLYFRTLLSGETLLIGVGSASVKFLELYTDLPETVTAELKFASSDSEKNKYTYKKNKCLIYKMKDILLCLCSPVIKNGNYKSWTREVRADFYHENFL